MHIKIINPKTDGKKAYSNKSSARQATNYLETEAKQQGETAVFFNSNRDDISGDEAVLLIDSNRKGLRKDDAKFYSLVISPSAADLEVIGNDPQKLRAYTARVMDEYAGNYNLKDGKKLGEKDLVWVAVQHDERKHRGHDGAPSGQKKEGPQTHIHVIVSARDREQKITLNPLDVPKRFYRVGFMGKSNAAFEQMYGPARDVKKDRNEDGKQAKTNTNSSRRPAKTAEEIAESIRRRAAASNGRSYRPQSGKVNWRLYETPEQVRDKRLFTQVDKANSVRPPEEQLRHNKVLEAARSQDYSKAFYGRLSQLAKEATSQKYQNDPYEFLRTGKVVARDKSQNDQVKQDKRLFDQVDRLNKKLPPDKRLEHNLVLQIAREQEYSKAFYGRLGRIGREASGPKQVREPYDFLRTGRVARAAAKLPGEELGGAGQPVGPENKRPQDPPTPAKYQSPGARINRTYKPTPGRTAAGIGRDLGRTLATEGYTQDIRGDDERD